MPRRVAVLMFDNVEVLDFAGPFEVFGMTRDEHRRSHYDVFLVAQHMKPVIARNNLKVSPDYTFETMPRADIVVIPGGPGTIREIHNPAMLEFISEALETTEAVLSICSGALLVASASPLDNLGATTHADSLATLKSISPRCRVYPEARVVDNGNLVFAGGVSKGIDASLFLVARHHGLDQARRTAEFMEYDWTYRLDDPAYVRHEI